MKHHLFGGLITITLVSSFVVRQIETADLGEACTSNFDCQYPHAECKPLVGADVCQQFGAHCQCADGYQSSEGSCKRRVRLGAICGPDTFCSGDDVICQWSDNYQASYCECDYGMELDEDEQRCVRAFVATSKSFNKTCSQQHQPEHERNDDVCLRGQTCQMGRCACRRGYRYASGRDSCELIDHGDLCHNDADCLAVGIGTSHCSPSNHTCQCTPGNHPISVTFRGQTRTVCHQRYIVNSQPIKDIGHPCNEDPATGPLTFCVAQSSCTSCIPHAVAGSSFCLTPEMKIAQRPQRQLETSSTKPPATRPKLALETTTVPYPKQIREIGSACHTTNDCLVANSMCSANKTCQCMRPYVRRGPFQCRLAAEELELGEFCNSGFDTCAYGAICLNSSCQCPEGFKPSPDNFGCIETSRTAKYGDACKSTLQCYGDLTCLDGYCLCFPGFKLARNNRCIKKQLQDICPTREDSECRFIKNAVCERGKCRCSFGYRARSRYECELLPRSEDMYQLAVQRSRCEEDVDCWYPPAPANSYCDKDIQFCVCDQTTSIFDAATNRCDIIDFGPIVQQCYTNRDCDDMRFPVCNYFTCQAIPPAPMASSMKLVDGSQLLVIVLTLLTIVIHYDHFVMYE